MLNWNFVISENNQSHARKIDYLFWLAVVVSLLMLNPVIHLAFCMGRATCRNTKFAEDILFPWLAVVALLSVMLVIIMPLVALVIIVPYFILTIILSISFFVIAYKYCNESSKATLPMGFSY